MVFKPAGFIGFQTRSEEFEHDWASAVSTALEMKVQFLTLRARWVALSALLALIWFGAPHSAGGLWRGNYFACLCSADVVAEFRDGAVFTHMDSWPGSTGSPAISGQISTKPAGSYRRTGWHSFEWS